MKEPTRLERLSVEEKRALLKRLLLEKTDTSAREFPLSYGQRALWFIHKLAPESAAYNVAFTARVNPEPDLPALKRALGRLVERHPALRTIFPEKAGEPVQRVLPAAEVDFTIVDAPAEEDCLRAAVVSEYRRPFGLDRPPFRVLFFRTPQRSGVLLISVHHLIFDAWSVQIVFEELRRLYEAELRGAPAELPRCPAQYADFVAWQQGMLKAPESARLREHWASVLSGDLPLLHFASARRRPPIPTGRGGSIPITLGGDLSERLRELARAHQTTLYTVTLAALQVLLRNCSGQEDILIGSPVSGRNQPQWTNIIGYFVNMVPIRADLSGNPPFADHLARARAAVLGALAHQDLPFPLMVEQLQVRRDSAGAPMIQVMFNMVSTPRGTELSRLFTAAPGAPGVVFGNVQFEPFLIPQQEGQFDLVIELTEVQGTVEGVLKYSLDLFEREAAERMACHYRGLLESVAANPQAPIGDLMLSPPERDELLL